MTRQLWFLKVEFSDYLSSDFLISVQVDPVTGMVVNLVDLGNAMKVIFFWFVEG